MYASPWEIFRESRSVALQMTLPRSPVYAWPTPSTLPVCVSFFFVLFCSSISESFLTVKGAALFLPRGKSPTSNSAPRISQRRNKHTGDLQKHLQTMFTVLRPEDTIRLAVRLESAYPQVTRYMVVVSTNGRQDTEESIVLGIDFISSDSCCTVGLVLPLWSDTLIHLDGDGGFSVSTVNRVHVFKPVSVQAMSALQSLHKACEVARCHNYYPGSLFLTWVSYYQSRVSSSQFCVNEWNAMQDVESHRANSPILFTDLNKKFLFFFLLMNCIIRRIRTELEMQMACNLREFKEFIDNEMIVILGQMDSPTEIFDHVFLGSEWNASNLEELQNSGVRYILNVTREIDNFFPGMFEYHNIRVYDEEATNLLEYWNDTYKFITKAKKAGAKCLVHCKMGVSRSASTVIAYAMKEYGWDLDTAFDYVKERRTVTKPNPSFMKQLEEYQGILLASKQRHNKLWRSHSDSDLSDRPDSMCKPSSPMLRRADSHNNNTTSSPSLHHFLGVAVLQALCAEPSAKSRSSDLHALSNGIGESPLQEGPRLPLPRPRAATVIPEEKLDSWATIAVTVPAALPHPPPSLHILPPTPELHRRAPSTLQSDSEKCKPVEPSLSFAGTHSSEEISALNRGSGDDSDALQESPSDSSGEQTPLCPAAAATAHPLPLTLSDDNNNPSEPLTGSASDSSPNHSPSDSSSNHSSDSIDFFSAREKFVGLAQEPEQLQQRLAPAQEGDAQVKGEEEPEDGRSQVGSVLSLNKMSLFIHIDHQAEPEPPLLPLSSSPPSSPSWLPGDQQAGSVRRATKQLEQKLRLELEQAVAQRSPLHSPGTEPPPLRPAPSSLTPDRVPADIMLTSSLTSTAELQSSLHTSARSSRLDHPNSQSTQRPAALNLDGVTAEETETDGCPQDGCPQDGCGRPCGPGSESRGLGAPPSWQRTLELEARMRQAGLTPPSLMKRSASLAKLDCLELSANDLCDLDLTPPSSSSSSSCQDSSHPDDTWKKQKVLSLNPSPADSPSPPSHSSSSRDSEGAETDGLSSGASPSSQQGRGHSSRRRKASAERRRAVALLYNTM
uniref:protein-serine/threonine phosphatase n=1 Tax=Poecilia latipinna TaxID=48699 RepID=A0A3B3VG10_9TELE